MRKRDLRVGQGVEEEREKGEEALSFFQVLFSILE